jgi:arabinofuranosyltransferase
MRAAARLLPPAALAWGAAALVAWVCDDAYISFRASHHWLLGHGPVFNVGERVVAFTHPLWLALVTAAAALSGEHYVTAIALGLALTALTLGALARLPGAAAGAPALLGLAASKAFAEFSTSGLENSLAHALLALAAVALSRPALGPGALRGVALALGLLPLVRPDLGLITLPPGLLLLHLAPGHRGALLLGLLGPGAAAALGMLIWSGFPYPNTAAAKLGHADLPWRALMGWRYLEASLRWDPITPAAVALGLGRALLRARAPGGAGLGALALGALLYALYPFWMGGDFMSGRFYTAPLVVAVAGLLIGDPDAPPRGVGRPGAALFGALALAAGLLNPVGPWRAGRAFHVPNWDDAGIADERGWYYPHLGLWPMLAEGRDPPKPGGPRRPGEPAVRMGKAIGLDAYMAGPGVHLVDAYALCDPLLARIPSDEVRARPGHWIRPVPAGYRETLLTGQPHFTDPEVAALWADLQLATRGPLLAPGRAAALLRLNLRGRTAPIRGVPPARGPGG